MFGVFRKSEIDPSTWISRTTKAALTTNLENETISLPPFPGPEIRVKRGDWVNVTVINWLDDVTTSIHWHGILMQNNAWMDGSFAVTQCGIAPEGGSFRYGHPNE
jgi:FtsP/CotA-like multicopper oxidase with cupredoxin domain